MAAADLDASEIEVEVRSGEVVLKGKVSSRDDKFAAEYLAESVMGVKDVQNELRINRSNNQARDATSRASATLTTSDTNLTGASSGARDYGDAASTRRTGASR